MNVKEKLLVPWGAYFVLISLLLAFTVVWGMYQLDHRRRVDACNAIRNEYGVDVLLIENECYVKIGKKYRLERDWTIPERLEYLSKKGTTK